MKIYLHLFIYLYFVFILTYRACQVCTPNATNSLWSHCQCVLADGVERGMLSINRMLPGPSIQVRFSYYFIFMFKMSF